MTLELLRAHLRRRACEEPLADSAPCWLKRVQAGDFEAIPPGLAWANAVALAHLIDGYALCEEAGLGEPFAYAARKWQEAERTGRWSGTALELWVCLFLAYRQDRHQGGLPAKDEPLLDGLCRGLRRVLAGRSVPAGQPATT